MTKNVTSFETFLELDIRAGTILQAESLPKAKVPAYILKVDLGHSIGIKTSTARITDLYSPQDLIGKQVMCVVNFPSMKVAGVSSEILVCGFYNDDKSVTLVCPDKPVKNGAILG